MACPCGKINLFCQARHKRFISKIRTIPYGTYKNQLRSIPPSHRPPVKYILWNAKWGKNRIKSLPPSHCSPVKCTRTTVLLHAYYHSNACVYTTALLHRSPAHVYTNIPPHLCMTTTILMYACLLLFCCMSTTVLLHAHLQYHRSAARLLRLLLFWCTSLTVLLHIYHRSAARLYTSVIMHDYHCSA